MMSGKKLFAALLCPFLVIGVLLLLQGCGKTEKEAKGAAEETAKPAAQAGAQETAKPAEEMKPQLEPRTEQLAVAAYTCPMHPEATSLAPGKCGICGMDLVKTEAEYTCTMCKDVHEHKPGKCPKCGMDLVLRPIAKKKEAEAGH